MTSCKICEGCKSKSDRKEIISLQPFCMSSSQYQYFTYYALCHDSNDSRFPLTSCPYCRISMSCSFYVYRKFFCSNPIRSNYANGRLARCAGDYESVDLSAHWRCCKLPWDARILFFGILGE